MVVKAIQDGKAKLVFLAHDAGPNLTKKIQDKGHYYQVEIVTVFSTLELSIAVGKSRKVLAVTDAGFTKKMRSLME
ncbi:ribosomal protein L7Ae/L30e/S12e/Gadd45 family protein [Streptococcus mitis SK564]|uniref:Ribosomal protein L7Ae/L30e/S12e/Gadd45 family protein n=1 Tax=Streptococcus mitis SK564 TaxID=585203 RepID=E1LMH0_STRMT|nr:ribosomal protein L7Ae/L30e/S12e/Gadd45 family protein [Streptococcus mitis SK564]